MGAIAKFINEKLAETEKKIEKCRGDMQKASFCRVHNFEVEANHIEAVTQPAMNVLFDARAMLEAIKEKVEKLEAKQKPENNE